MLGSETWIILLAGVVCAIIALIVARIIADRGSKPADVTIGFLGPSLAALYLLVLAVSLATEWQTIGNAATAVTAEASAARGLYYSAAGMTPSQRAYLHAHVQAYTATVVNHDWPQMRRGTLDDKSEQMLTAMNNYVLAINPQSAGGTNAQLQATSQLSTLLNVHDQRETYAEEDLPFGLLAGVIATSLVVASFPFFCGVGGHRAGVALAAMQAALIGVGIVVVFQLNHAYSGPLAVSPAAMHAVLHQLTGP